jgi:uncharacterized protein YjbI with pentapeptide repeats
MNNFYEEHFEQLDNNQSLIPGEYEACSFENCSLREIDLSTFKFMECTFTNCDLSNATITNTMFQDVDFNQCKLLGLLFTDSNPFGFGVRFHQCILSEASFYELNLTQCSFTECTLHHTDFAQVKAQGISFYQSDLKGAIFENSQLQKADFRKAIHYSIDPNTNQLKGARFSLPEVIHLLSQYQLRIENE